MRGAGGAPYFLDKMVAKSPDAFRTISEVADDLDLPQHVLRFWETRFTQIKPLKRGGGRRYYRPDDVDLLRGIRFLLYSEGYTIRGVQRILKEQGPRFVIGAGRGEYNGVPGRRDAANAADEEAGTIAETPAGRVEPAFSHAPRGGRRAAEVDVEREDHDPDEEDVDADDGAPPPVRPAAGQPVPASRSEASRATGLSREDAERLQATLAELLELKRILDQARQT